MVDIKIGDIVRSKKTNQLLIVDGVSSFTIFMHSDKETTPQVKRGHKYCRKRQFDMFYEKVENNEL